MRKSTWLLWPCAALLCAFTASSAQTAPSAQAGKPALPAGKSAPAPATARIYGTVTDTLGEPISDALVEISGRGPFSSIMLRTSESGEFSIDTLVVGETYTVAVMRFGYRAIETKPFVASATPKLLTMVLRPRRTITMRAQASPPKAKLIRNDSTSFQPEKAE